MIIGGKLYEVGQRIRIVSAKSSLHYNYGMNGSIDERMKGVTGIIVSESNYEKNAMVNLKVDEPYRDKYINGMTRLFCDDEIELLEDTKNDNPAN